MGSGSPKPRPPWVVQPRKVMMMKLMTVMNLQMRSPSHPRVAPRELPQRNAVTMKASKLEMGAKFRRSPGDPIILVKAEKQGRFDTGKVLAVENRHSLRVHRIRNGDTVYPCNSVGQLDLEPQAKAPSMYCDLGRLKMGDHYARVTPDGYGFGVVLNTEYPGGGTLVKQDDGAVNSLFKDTQVIPVDFKAEAWPTLLGGVPGEPETDIEEIFTATELQEIALLVGFGGQYTHTIVPPQTCPRCQGTTCENAIALTEQAQAMQDAYERQQRHG